MDILSDYRITALLVTERELAQRAERARVAAERAVRPVRQATPTGAIVCVPSTSH